MARLRAQVAVGADLFTNWYLIFTDGSYFESLGRPLALRHLWSLAVEEQFYLLWPLVMVFLLRRFRHRLGSIALIIGALGRRLRRVDGAALRTGDRPQPRSTTARTPGWPRC